MMMNMYFYREYGGKEVDVVLEDYRKRYACVEMKQAKTRAKSVFPLPHTLRVMHPDNYQDILITGEEDLYAL